MKVLDDKNNSFVLLLELYYFLHEILYYTQYFPIISIEKFVILKRYFIQEEENKKQSPSKMIK